MEEKKEIEIYVYSKDAMNKALAILKTVRVEGFEQAGLLSDLGKIICSPLQEGKATIGEEA